MKVILQADVKKLGKKGDLVNVAEGYARNFLIPKGMAVPASDSNLKSLQVEKSQERARRQRELDEARELAAKLEAAKVTIHRKTGEAGRLFGSVTAQDIAESAGAALGVELDKRKIELNEPIKALGTYAVTVRVHPGVSAELSVDVVQEQGD